MKTKRKMLMFHIYEYKVLEDYLHEMAKKGWVLDHFGEILKSTMIFRPCTPKDQSFYVDFYDASSMMSTDEDKDLKAYRSLVEEYGYHYLAGNAELQVYEKSRNVRFPIREDNGETQKQMKHFLLRRIWLPIMIIVTGVIQIFQNLLISQEMSNQNVMFFVMAWAFFIIGSLLHLIPDIIWLSKKSYHSSLQQVVLRQRGMEVLGIGMILCLLVFFQSPIVWIFVMTLVYAYALLWLNHKLEAHPKRTMILLLAMAIFLILTVSIYLNVIK